MSPPRDPSGRDNFSDDVSDDVPVDPPVDAPVDPPPSSMRYLKARLASASAAARRLRDGAPDPRDTVEDEAVLSSEDQDFVEEGTLVAPGDNGAEGRVSAEGHVGRVTSRRSGATGTVISPIPSPPPMPMPPGGRSEAATGAAAPVAGGAPLVAEVDPAEVDPATDSASVLTGPERPTPGPSADDQAPAPSRTGTRPYRGGFSWGPGPKGPLAEGAPAEAAPAEPGEPAVHAATAEAPAVDAATTDTEPGEPPPRGHRRRFAGATRSHLTTEDLLDLGQSEDARDPAADDQRVADRDGAPDQGDAGPGTALVPAPTPPFELEPDDGTQRLLRPSGLRDRRYRRRHGVAPFVRPASRRSRRKRRRDYRRLGFIELTQEKLKLRHRILPRTVIGISLMILALGVGAAFAGAALYAFYDYRQTQNETRVDAFAAGFEKQYAAALGQLQGVRDQAIQSVNDGLGPLQAWQDDANALTDLPAKVGGGVWTLHTLDAAGKPVIGSAFVVSSDATSSLLLTSYETVSAATAQPGPAVAVEKGGERLAAELYRWDAPSDLALLRVAKGGLPALTWVPEAVRAQAIGKHVYAVSGLGGAGAKASGGIVIDQSSAGLQHNIQISPDFRGGPIVTADGQVLAVATSAYQPLGFDGGPLPFAPLAVMACVDEKVLVCPPALVGSSPATTPTTVRGR